MAQLSTGHVFMSYSRKDDAIMRRIVAFLRAQGIKVWVDNEKLVPGTPIWEEAIEKAIKNAPTIVVVLSPDSKNSIWVRREISLADQYRKHIFPVLVRGDEDASITLRLITNQFVDMRQNEEIGLNSLSSALLFYLEELEAQERKTQEEAEKLANVQAQRKTAEHEAARLKEEREAAEKTAREATEKVAREKAKHESIELAARKKIEQEAAEKTAREQAKRKALEKATREKAEREADPSLVRFVYVTVDDGTPLYQSLPSSNNWIVWLEKGAKLSIAEPIENEWQSIGKYGHYVEVADSQGNEGYVTATAVSIERP